MHALATTSDFFKSGGVEKHRIACHNGRDLPEYVASFNEYVLHCMVLASRTGGSFSQGDLFFGKTICLVSRLRTLECARVAAITISSFALWEQSGRLDLVLELLGLGVVPPRSGNDGWVSVPKAILSESLVKRCSRLVCGNSLKGSNQFNPAILGTSVFRMALLSVQRTRPIKTDPFDTPARTPT